MFIHEVWFKAICHVKFGSKQTTFLNDIEDNMFVHEICFKANL